METQEVSNGVLIDDEEELLLWKSQSESQPADHFHLAYLVYFILGIGFLTPWNSYITAVDYFTYLYPSVPVDRVFAVAYMSCCLVSLIIIITLAHNSSACLRINIGMGLFVLSLVITPVVDWVFVKGRQGVYFGYDITVGAVVISGLADALVQGGIIGSAGELPEIYMQAVCSGTAASGVLISILRIITKSIYPQDVDGLRKSANLYFAVSIVVMIMCIFCYNLGDRIPIVRHYKEIKRKAVKMEIDEKGFITLSTWRSTLWKIICRVKWFGFGIFMIYLVTLSIFPGYITEDVYSDYLKDWYPIILITAYNVFDLIGKVLPAVYPIDNENVAVGASVGRLLFFPLYLGCIHGPEFFRSEIPVTFLTCLLGLTNGYFTTVLLTLAPKSVPIQHSEMAGISIVLFLGLGLVGGSIVSWFWVI
ncbi:Equilibrative nucleoside transporter 1 [Zostera marina]|uniref:Equilibrative nucleoside transporter 1 n=1 Tax=Zostera marina TaxID=29655 RepID=A0A0K9NQ14_ZOSMR|nr:Equilibrative nucleoside transporter 1 [Zostera marina]